MNPSSFISPIRRPGPYIPWIATALLFGLGGLLFRPYFSSNDDTTMMLLLRGLGFSEEPVEFLFFINIALGWCLRSLYVLAPDVPWYGLFLFGLLFMSIAGFLAVLIPNLRSALSRTALALFLIPAFCSIFASPHYTLIAFLAIQSGLLLLFHPPGSGRGPALGGIGLLLIGGLLRWEMVPLALILALPLILLSPGSGKFRCPAGRPVAIFASTLALLSLFVLLDAAVYRTNPGWESARREVRLHNSIVEYKMPDHTSNRKVFDQAGWSPTDLALYAGYYWSGEKFAAERCTALNRGLPYEWRIKVKFWVPQFFRKRNYTRLGILLLLAGFAALSLPHSRRPLALLLAWNAATLAGLVLFLKVPGWILFPQWFLACIGCLLFVGMPPSRERTRMRWAVPLLLLPLAVLMAASDLSKNASRRMAEPLLENSLKGLDHSGRTLYLVGSRHLPFEGIPVFGDWSLYKGIPLVWFSWPQSIPPMRRTLEHFGLADPIRDMVGREDVLLIANGPILGIMGRYLEESFGIRAVFEPVRREPIFIVQRAVQR